MSNSNSSSDDEYSTELSPETLAILQDFLKDKALQERVSKEISDFSTQIEKGDALTAKMATPEYWETRYVNDPPHDDNDDNSDNAETFDWLADYAKVGPVLEEWIGAPAYKAGRTLITGCGNSLLTECMARDGQWHNIYSVDCSPTVIRVMKERTQKRLAPEVAGQIAWEVQDIREMSYPNESFDVIVDKATVDALLADKSEQDEDGVCPDVAKTLNEFVRVLKPGGVFIWISFGRPKTALLNRMPWGAQWKIIEKKQIGDPGCITFDAYLLKKN